MQCHRLAPFDLNSPAERGKPVVLPSGKTVRAITESQFAKNCLRYFQKLEREKQKEWQ